MENLFKLEDYVKTLKLNGFNTTRMEKALEQLKKELFVN